MPEKTMGAVERRFADLIWDNEPITAAELARLADRELGWKKTTAYTALKRLCEKGIFRNESGVVTSVLSREEYLSRQSRKFLDDTCGGSLPAFIAAFTKRGGLSRADLDEIRKMLDEYEKEV